MSSAAGNGKKERSTRIRACSYFCEFDRNEFASLEAPQPNPSADITAWLLAWSAGDERALGELIRSVYAELGRLASSYLRREHPGHTLDTSALVHEAYLRLAGQRRVEWRSRSHFFGIAAQAMRRILVDHARGQLMAKRGGGSAALVLDEALSLAPQRAPELVAVDEALDRLERIAPRQARIVEMRFFAGLTAEEIAQALRLSVPTVTREWRAARAWLYCSLQQAG